MYICKYVYMHICIYVYMYICMYVCIHVYMYICIYVNMYICIYVYMYICIYVYMYIWIYVYMYICIYVYMYICIYVYIYICPEPKWKGLFLEGSNLKTEDKQVPGVQIKKCLCSSLSLKLSHRWLFSGSLQRLWAHFCPLNPIQGFCQLSWSTWCLA